MVLISTLDIDLDIGASLARANSHFLVVYQKVDLLRDHCISANKHIGIKAIDNIKLAS